MPRDREDPLASPTALVEGLRQKSRRRRANLDRPSLAGGRVRNDLTPKLVLTERAPADLKAPVRAVRACEPGQVQRVVASIRALGFCDPVLIDGEDQVLDGVVRVEAAKLAGLNTIPCIVVDHLTAEERRVLRLALNRVQERGSWDLDELKLEFEELSLEDGLLEITGFTDCEIDQILLDAEPSPIEVGPLLPARGATTDVRVGDIFALGRHRVICGDARDPRVLAALMGEEKARLILTDEPYNVPVQGHVTGGDHREFAMASGEMSEAEFLAFNRDWMGTALPYLVDGGVFGTFIDWRGLATVHAAANEFDLEQLNLIVWGKTNPGMGSLYRSQHELLPLFKKGRAPHINNVGLGRCGRSRSNLWMHPGASSLGSSTRKGLQDHPTVKPVALLVDAMFDLTYRDDIILDPFLGSGSTLVAAEQAGRRCLGIEVDPSYIDIILKRHEFAGSGGAVKKSNVSVAAIGMFV